MEPVHRYQRDTPGELIHVDIKKLAGIPDGGGWRTRGRGYKGEGATTRRVGYPYIHTAIDDRTRIAYSQILTNEKGTTAAGFWRRAAAWYLSIGINPQRVITDNGSVNRVGHGHESEIEVRDKETTMAKRPNILILWGDDIGWYNISHNNRGALGY
jgi:hypothetical protein